MTGATGKRIAAGVAMAVVVATITVTATAATEIQYKPLEGDAQVVMTVNGMEVKAGEYASYMRSIMQSCESQYAQPGDTNFWANKEVGELFGPMVSEQASEQLIAEKVLLDRFQKENLKMDGPHQQSMQQYKRELQDQMAQINAVVNGKSIEEVNKKEAYESALSEAGLTPQTYDNRIYLNECYAMLEEKLFGENGTQVPSDEELLAYFNDNYLSAKHILIQVGDGMHTDEEAHAIAEQALERIKGGESFDTIMTELSEDPGSKAQPEGYVFTEDQMVKEFSDATKALKENEISGLVKSEFGYHIIQRLPLNAEEKLDDYRELLCQLMGKDMNSMLTQWRDEADIQKTDLFEKITYKNVKDYLPADVVAADANAGANNATTDANTSTDDATTDANTSTSDNAATPDASQDTGSADDAATDANTSTSDNAATPDASQDTGSADDAATDANTSTSDAAE